MQAVADKEVESNGMRPCLLEFRRWVLLGTLLLVSCGDSAGPGKVPDSECPAYAVEGLEVGCVTPRRTTYVVIRVDLRAARIQMLWKNPAGVPYGSLDQAYSQLGDRLLALTNAGIYSAAHAPEGLHVEEGTTLSPLNLKGGDGNFYLKPNGVFYVAEDGAGIAESEKFSSMRRTDIREATQSGPLLVVDGEINRALRPDSQSLYVRNGIGVKSPEEVYLVLSKGAVSLHEFASVFTEQLHCRDALYLDGCVSQLYLPARDIHLPEQRQCDKELVGLLGVSKR